MGLPISLNPCEDLNAYVDQKTHELEQAGVTLKGQINTLRNTLKSYAQVPSLQGTIDDAIALASVNDINAGTTAITQIRNFTGSCLDPVYNGVRSYALDIDGQVTDAIDDITSFVALPEVNLLKPLRAATTALGGADLSGLVNNIDDKLGCLSEQGSELGECLSMVDNFADRVTDVLSYLGLGDDAVFDLDYFVSDFNISINGDVLDNLKSLDFKMDDLTVEALKNTFTAMPGLTALAPEYY
jgi:hypothetical protein